MKGPENSIGLTRYDLGGEPAEAADHVIAVMQGSDCESLILVGYSADEEVTPAADKLREAASEGQMAVRMALRVEEGRYWSYADQGEGSLPPDGVPFEGDTNPVTSMMIYLGATALGGRDELARLVEPTEAMVSGETFDDVTSKLVR